MQTNLNFIKTQLLYYDENITVTTPSGESHWGNISNPSQFYLGKENYKTQIVINPNAFKSANQYSSIKYVLTATEEIGSKKIVCGIPRIIDGKQVIFDVTTLCQTLTEETIYLISCLSEIAFEAIGDMAPHYEVVPKHVENVPTKAIEIGAKAKTVIDLQNDKTQSRITLVGKDSAFGKADVDLVFVQGEIKTSFDEKFLDGVHTDLFGNQRSALEWFYYYDENGEKVIIDSSCVTACLDGKFTCVINGETLDVKRLQTLGGKTTVQMELKDVKKAELQSQRSEEMQEVQKQFENSKKYIEELVYGKCSVNSLGETQITDTIKFHVENSWLESMIKNLTLTSVTDGERIFLLPFSNYLNLKNSRGKSSGDSYVFDEVQEYLLDLTPSVYEELKKAYESFVTAKETVEYYKRNTPINFISSDGLHKGFNEFGELIILFTSQNDFVAINRSKTGKIETLSNPKEKVVDFKYDKKGEIEYVVDSRGRVTAISKCDDGALQITYPNGKVLTVVQTEQGVNQIEYDGIIVSITYSDDKMLSVIRTDKESQKQIDSVEVVKTENTVTLTESDGSGKKLTVEGGEITQKIVMQGGVVTEAVKYEEVSSTNYRFYPSKLVINAKKDSLFKLESDLVFATGTNDDSYDEFSYVEFNDEGNPVYTEELSENVLTKTEFFYDEDKLLTKKAINYKKTLENTVVYEYNVIENYAYDSVKRLVKTVSYVVGEELSNGKSVEEWIYDEQGNLTQNFTYNTLDSSSKFYKVESAFDQNGKHIADLDQTGEHKTQVEYVDGSSLVKTLKTPDGTKFSYGYDLADNVTAITQSTVGGEENSTQRVYENGLLKKLVSGNVVVEYTYDQKRRLSSVIVNGIVQKTYAYSDDDKTVTVTDVDGNAVTTEKDDFGNVISDSKNGAVIETNSYENGLLKTKVKDGVTYTYTYNDQDQVVSVSYSDGTPADTFTYDDFGNVVQKTEQGKTTVYTYTEDSLHKLEKATVDDIEITPKTDVNGRVVENKVKQGETLIEKTTTAYLKKGDHATTLPQSIRYWDNTLNGYKDILSYSYDGSGNITQINQNGKLLAKYTYDGLNRLIREDNVALNKTYLIEYDGTGNITAKRTCPFTLEKAEKIIAYESEDIFAYDKDILVAKNDLECEYVNGRPTKYMGEDIAFAEKGLVSSFKGVAFSYDSFGKRTAKGDITFAYDKNGRLISQSNGIVFIYDHSGAKIGVAFDGINYYFRKNMQGDVIALYTQSGLVATYVYDAWGNHKIYGANGVEIANNEHIAHLNPIRYRGYYYDTETNLYYLKTRYYDSSVGRFISPDSVDYLSADKINGLNLYAYCSNDPINKVDPTGQFGIFGWIIAVVASIVLGGLMGNAHKRDNATNRYNNPDIDTIQYTTSQATELIYDITKKYGNNGITVGLAEFKEEGVHIENSYLVSSMADRLLICQIICKTYIDGKPVTKRHYESLAAEWFGHNLLSFFGIESSRTDSVDLDFDFSNNDDKTKIGTILLWLVGLF